MVTHPEFVVDVRKNSRKRKIVAAAVLGEVCDIFSIITLTQKINSTLTQRISLFLWFFFVFPQKIAKVSPDNCAKDTTLLLTNVTKEEFPLTIPSSMVNTPECVKGASRTESPTSTSTTSSEEDGLFVTTATTSSHHHPQHEKLGLLPLTVLIFYSVSGGPFGVEESVRSAGHFCTLCGFVIAPFVWSIQEAAMTAELAAAFPEASGGVAWVETAFGSQAGWMAGYLGWISGATDNAIYPVLFLDYLVQVLQSGEAEEAALHPVWRFFLLAAMSMGLAYINWLGLSVVGKMSIAICCISMSPFLLMSIIGAFQCDPSRWFELPEPAPDSTSTSVLSGVMWRPFLNNLFWNLNSFDSVASISADTEDPGRVFPKAMFWSVILVVAGYFVPLLVALGATDAPPEAWQDGYLARVAEDIAGPWLGAWTVFAAAISNIALFLAELTAESFQCMGMAERGFLPECFAQRSRHGTPTYGIVLGTVVIVVMGVTNLDKLIEMLNFNYAIALLLEYAAFIKLRMARPDLPRPWRVPLGTMGCIMALIPTIIMLTVIMSLATPATYVFSIGTNLVGLLVYRAKERGACGSMCRKYSPVAEGDTAAEGMELKTIVTGQLSTEVDHSDSSNSDFAMEELSGSEASESRMNSEAMTTSPEASPIV